jgi:hypothetical protein
MSSFSPHLSSSYSQFGAIFDTALKAYAQKTGTDLSTHPLATILEACDSPDKVLGVLQEQAHAFNQYRNGEWKVQLMRRLKPTVDILLGLSTSGVFGEGIGLVRPTKYTFPLQMFIILFPANSGRKIHICRCWSPALRVYHISSLVLVLTSSLSGC